MINVSKSVDVPLLRYRGVPVIVGPGIILYMALISPTCIHNWLSIGRRIIGRSSVAELREKME